MLPILGLGAGVGGSIIGGLINKSSADADRKQQLALAKQNIKLQKQFAQQGIRWKVADARAAGVHPLYALGANTTSFSPISVGTQTDTSMGDAMASVGQDISRAMQAASTREERLNDIGTKLQLENQSLQNELLRSQIARMNSAQIGPALPSNSGMGYLTNKQGQGDAYVLENPLERIHSAPGHPNQEVGKIPDLGWAQTRTGMVPVPSQDVKQRIEDQFVPETAWAIRNNLMPNFGRGDPPPRHLLPAGATSWRWAYSAQEWRPNYTPDRPRRAGWE